MFKRHRGHSSNFLPKSNFVYLPVWWGGGGGERKEGRECMAHSNNRHNMQNNATYFESIEA